MFEDTTAGSSLKVKGLAQLPGDGDQIIIEGVGGKYEITDSTVLMMIIILFLHWKDQMFLMIHQIKIWHQMHCKMLQ